jgi:hypothetical protein
MGLPVNLEDSAMLSGSFAQVRIESIIEVLDAKFPGKMPADLGERLATLDRDELREILRKSATATSVEEALSAPTAATHGR